MAIVMNPTAGDVHVNRPLSNFSQKWLQDQNAFVSAMAMPNLPVQKQSDLYYVFNRGDFYRDSAELRADSTPSTGGGFQLSTQPYFANVYAFHKDVSDRQRANQDAVIQLDQSATQFVTTKLMIRREAVFADRYMSATNSPWFNGTAAAVPAGDSTKNWRAANSDPITDFSTAIRQVHEVTGYRPNKCVMSRDVYDALIHNDEVVSRIIGGSSVGNPALVKRELLAEELEIEKIFIMDGVRNNGLRGEADDLAFFTSGVALVYYAPDMANIETPSAGVQFSWTGLLGSTANGMRIRRFRVEENAAERIEGEMAFDFKVVAGEMGYMFTNAIS